MSYDIYCYKSKFGKPDEEEADRVVGADNDKWAKKECNPEMKLAIVKALKAYNPRLETFDFDFSEIAKLTATTIQEAQRKFNHIELNPPVGDIAIQLTVYDNSVFITVPYWYQDEKARHLFSDIKSYIKVISETAGYFVWDPQTGQIFDPADAGFEGLNQYLFISEHLDEIVNPKEPEPMQRKPWWKLW